ncbi:hypothetical protein GJ744_007236 [Endocarpon pusillum]|uniref:Uncharacterized protein n=1 Tax=Endocarpon pusillum TaxID=364733 RepID=A0A8H7E5C7_9EURO|nr:hypothetical protein GJ744_007236 [Endocarpon pusillum]
MKLTPTLYVRSWIAKLHPPMPTTPQENKQLLSLLSSSFQRRLDDAHPPVQPKENMPQASVCVSGPAVDNSSARATVDHLQSLLHHPLLAQNAAHPPKAQTEAAQAATMMDQAMLRGQADLDLVDRCMQVYLRTLQGGQVKDEFRLGRRISAWFTSSNPATKERFLSSPGALCNAVPILYADGLEGVVWEWLGVLYSRKVDVVDCQGETEVPMASKPSQWVLQETHLTFLMIKEALRRSRLNAAVQQLVQACAYMSNTGRMSSLVRSSQPWQASTRAVTLALLRRRHRHGLSAVLFEQFLDHRSSWADPDSLTSKLIPLYHPTRPSAQELAMTVEQANDSIPVHFDHIKVMSGSAQKVVLNALLDGAQLLLLQDSSSVRQAQLILDLVEKQFPNLSDFKQKEATQKRIQSFRQTILPQQFVDHPIGVI